jgi:Fic family protein
MQTALDLADLHRPVTVQDVCDLHARLLEGTRDQRWGGVVRSEQNWVGGVSPCRAAYVPPPYEYVPGLLKDLCEYISSDDHPPIVQAALAHAQFETIHPFVDGNGRVGRALIHLVLRRRGLAPRFVPPVSLILATNAGAYIAGLVAYRYSGPSEGPIAMSAAIQWIDRFVNELLRACNDADAFAHELELLEKQWRARVGRVRASSATDVLLAALPGIPVLTVETAAGAIGRSAERTNDAVNRLKECGVLRQGSVGRRNRVFEVADLLAAVTALERKLASPAADTDRAKPTRTVPNRSDHRISGP